MIKLREVDLNDSVNQGREIEVSEEQAKELFEYQNRRGVVAWVEVKENEELQKNEPDFVANLEQKEAAPAEQAPATEEAPKAKGK